MSALNNPDVNETVLAEWTDADSHGCTLGSLTPLHKRDTGLTMKVTTDERQRVWAWFILALTVKTAGRERRRELTLVIPPHCCYTLSFSELQVSQIHTPALFSAVGDARLFDSGNVIRADFALSELGCVLMPNTTAKKIAPASRTTADLLHGLCSLSQSRAFSVYIKPSDYARQGLKLVCHRNCVAPPLTTPFAIEDVVDDKSTEVDWSLFGIEPGPIRDNPPSSAPPPYLGPTPPPGESEPAISLLSPPVNGPTHMRPSTAQSVVSETDHEQYTQPDHQHDDKDHHRNQAPPLPRKRPLTPTTRDHPLPSPQRPRPSNNSPASTTTNTRDTLTANLGEWVEAALATNPHAYEHPRLQAHLSACATHALAANSDAFVDARATLAAEFFFDPQGTDANDDAGAAGRRESFVADMARLLRWGLGKRGSVDVENWETFLFWGRGAREAVDAGATAASAGGNGKGGDACGFRKALCVSCVLLSCAAV